MFGYKKKQSADLGEMTGFNLAVYNADGEKMSEIGMHAISTEVYDRVETIMLSFARSLAYMHGFYCGKKSERKFYKAHLHDLERKLKDFNKEVK